MASAESTPVQVAPRPRRRWLRFSLRSLLILITVLSVWLGVKVNQARRQKEAVAALRALGAEIWYDHQRTSAGGFDVKIELDVPAWARELCGDDFFQTVTGIFILRPVSIDNEGRLPRAITDEDLQCLADLPYLEQLLINHAPITDAGLAHLPHVERMRAISLDDTKVGDGFVARLKGAARLESLGLERTLVTDDALAELTNLPNLQALRLRGTDTGDRALAPFAERELVVLTCGRKTTNAGLRQMRTLANAIQLEASNCEITGEALLGFSMPKAMIAGFTNCRVGDDDLAALVGAVRGVGTLSLKGCPITDQGLQHLKELQKTRYLTLSNTEIRGRELGQLSSLAGLAKLDLSGCPLDNPDLKALAPLYTRSTPATSLLLANTDLTDYELAQISGFASLQHLDVSYTSVTDGGLPHLHALKKLRRLDLRGAGVTSEGVAQLKQAIPGLEVAWDEDAGWRK